MGMEWAPQSTPQLKDQRSTEKVQEKIKVQRALKLLGDTGMIDSMKVLAGGGMNDVATLKREVQASLDSLITRQGKAEDTRVDAAIVNRDVSIDEEQQKMRQDALTHAETMASKLEAGRQELLELDELLRTVAPSNSESFEAFQERLRQAAA